MRSIRQRPERVVERAREVLAADGRQLSGARVIVVGAAYKSGVRDLRESSGGADASRACCARALTWHYYDPLVPGRHRSRRSRAEQRVQPRGPDWDLVIVHTLHPGVDYSWANPARSSTRRTGSTTRPSGPWYEDAAHDARSSRQPAAPDVSTPAVVLKFDPNVMHHGGLGAIRSLGRMGVPVYAVQESSWSPAAHSRYLRGQVLWQPAGQSCRRDRAGLRGCPSSSAGPPC